MTQPHTLVDAIRHFSDPDVCLKFLRDLRWPDGNVTCPTCGREDPKFIESRRIWQCRSKHPKRQFSIKVGTIFEDSPIGLDKWLAGIWLISNAKNGISSYELHRALGVTQKTGWFMLHRIRLAMQSGSLNKLQGDVEVDETWIGGKARNMHKHRITRVRGKGHGMVGKTAVMGLLERHGPDGYSQVRTKVISANKRHILFPVIRENVSEDAEVMTDAHPAYFTLGEEFMHQMIDHAESYVNGKVHTNGIENFWSLLKRAIKGTYVSVEPFHLFRYVDEQAMRFNTRKQRDGDRFAQVVISTHGRRLTYKELTGATATSP